MKKADRKSHGPFLPHRTPAAEGDKAAAPPPENASVSAVRVAADREVRGRIQVQYKNGEGDWHGSFESSGELSAWQTLACMGDEHAHARRRPPDAGGPGPAAQGRHERGSRARLGGGERHRRRRRRGRHDDADVRQRGRRAARRRRARRSATASQRASPFLFGAAAPPRPPPPPAGAKKRNVRSLRARGAALAGRRAATERSSTSAGHAETVLPVREQHVGRAHGLDLPRANPVLPEELHAPRDGGDGTTLAVPTNRARPRCLP